MCQGGFAPAAKHPCDFFLACFAFNGAQTRKGAPMRHFFAHHEMGRSGRGHLRKMRDAQHLVAGGQHAHFCADRMGDFAPYIRVNLVEDEERDGILEREGRFDRQHHPRDFAARSDHPQRLERLARIRGKEQLESNPSH